MLNTDLTIVIVSWNVKDLLQRCLKSLTQVSDNLNKQIIVIDNASTDDSVAMVRADFPQVELIANTENLGFAKANNQGIEKSKKSNGRYVLLLNPDTEVEPDSLAKMFQYMTEHPKCGIAGCRLLNSDNTLQPSVRRFPTLRSQMWILLKGHHIFPSGRYFATDFNYERGQEADQIMGAFFLIRREVIDQIGSLDDKFYIWFEEVDYCKRAKAAGWQVCYTPVTEIIHFGGQSFDQLMSLPKQKIFNRSLLYFFKKHHSLVSWLILLSLHPLSLFLAWLVTLRRSKNKVL